MPDFDESPYTPDELAMLRTGEATEIPAGQEHEPLAMIYRKAKAFDALERLLMHPCEPTVSLDYWPLNHQAFAVEVNRDPDDVSHAVHGTTLLDAVESMIAKEPTDA